MKNIEIPFDLIQLRNETKNKISWKSGDIAGGSGISVKIHSTNEINESAKWKVLKNLFYKDRIECESFILCQAVIGPSQYLPKTHKIAKIFMILLRCKIVFAICICAHVEGIGDYFIDMYLQNLCENVLTVCPPFFVHLIKATQHRYIQIHTLYMCVCWFCSTFSVL